MIKIQIIQTIFMTMLFCLGMLEKNSIIQRETSFMPVYVISCLVYWIILAIIFAIMMHKNKTKERKFLIIAIVLSIEILLLGIFCGSIDRRIDIIEFSKHCKEVTATIYDVDYDITTKKNSTEERYTATIKYNYMFRYYVDGGSYINSISDSHTGRSSVSRASAMSSARNIDPKYEIGDTITIYYNINNPEDWRKDLGYASENVLNIIAIIIIGLRGFVLTKTILDYNKEKKQENII